MKPSAPEPSLAERLRAFALLSQCQAELACQLSRLLSVTASREPRKPARRPPRQRTPRDD